MLSGTLRKKDLPIVQQKMVFSGGTQKSRSRQKMRSRSKGITQTVDEGSYQLSKKNNSIKAYHFNNSIYQGQVKAFHRVGKGMIIHDNGLSGIIRSGTNRLKDHNVFFGQNIIISVIYKEHDLDFVYKNGEKILALNMQKKGDQISLNSPGYLVEFDYQRVSKLKFKHDVLVQKIVMTRQEIDEIINKEKFENIMREEHIDALKLKFFDPSFSNIQIIPKYINEVHIGFTELKPNQYSTTYELSFQQKDYHNRNLEGLGMILDKISHDSTKHFRYETRILERGFYSNGKLEYFGELFYANGNNYFGGIRDQKLHGDGILVYQNQNRFVVGKFDQGKPLYLDENLSYRLDTEEGRNLYMAFRRRLHSKDPEVWIDGQVLDLPDQDYFLQKLHECTHSNYQDQEVKNYLKQEEDLRLSRKVDEFQGRNSRSISGKISNTMSFGQKDDLNKNSVLGTINLVQNRNLTAQIGRQVEQQNLKRTIGNNLANNESSPLFCLGQNLTSSQPSYESPIKKIHSERFSPDQNLLNNPSVNGSIIQGFNFDGNHSSESHKNSRFVSSSQGGNKSPQQKSNGFLIEGRNSNASKNQNYPAPAYNITIRSPIEGSRVSLNSSRKSLSRSVSRSLSRRSSKSNGKKKDLFKGSEEFVKTFQRSRQTNEKRSILDRLYGQVNSRAQILEREYEMLERKDRSNYQSNKISPNKLNTNISQSQNKSYDYAGYSEDPTEMDVKIMIASNEALRLARQNKVKEAKTHQYDHYTHRKRFDYTSEIYDERGGRPYGNIGVLSKQTHFQRTPQKVSRFDSYETGQGTRTSKKQTIDGLVGRLYPKHLTQEYAKRPEQIYDSRYEQDRGLNRFGILRGDERKTWQQQQDGNEGKFPYGKDFKGSVLKHNAIVRS